MAKTKMPPHAVEQMRRWAVHRAHQRAARVEWFAREVRSVITTTLVERVTAASMYLQSRVVVNLSVPVERDAEGRVIKRSKPGEYPRADTVTLMRDIFVDVERQASGVVEGRVGTTLDYGLILETSPRLRRRFLRRTLKEEQDTIYRIIGQERRKTRFGFGAK